MNRWLILGTAVLVAACGRSADFTAEQVLRANDAGVAIDGYSPVSYFQRGIAEAGSAGFAARHRGITYWMTDGEQLAAFQADPDRYAPAHGGWCSLMLTGSGRLTPANPETFKIVDGKLLMFWSGDYNDMSINGRSNWESKFPDAETELGAMHKADAVWQAIASGEKRARITLFNDDDRDRVAEHHRAVATQK